MVCLVLAIGVHAAVLFGVTFGFSLEPLPRLVDTLDVVLVQWRSEEEPEQADYLAQATQLGGGETKERLRPAEEVSGMLPTEPKGQDVQQSVQQEPEPSVDLREIVAVESAPDQVLDPTVVEQPEPERPDAAQLMSQSLDMASLQPETSRQREWRSKIPRREFISANTRKYEFASYMNAWVSKVERVGNLNYAPLPDNITEEVDILHITRTWRFESALGVSSN
jgi:protein TonB